MAGQSTTDLRLYVEYMVKKFPFQTDLDILRINETKLVLLFIDSI